MYDNKRNLYFIGLSLLFMGSKANKVHLQFKGAFCLTLFWGYYQMIKMIKEWEENTHQKWPVDENGQRYQLHHIIEQQ